MLKLVPSSIRGPAPVNTSTSGVCLVLWCIYMYIYSLIVCLHIVFYCWRIKIAVNWYRYCFGHYLKKSRLSNVVVASMFVNICLGLLETVNVIAEETYCQFWYFFCLLAFSFVTNALLNAHTVISAWYVMVHQLN